MLSTVESASTFTMPQYSASLALHLRVNINELSWGQEDHAKLSWRFPFRIVSAETIQVPAGASVPLN